MKDEIQNNPKLFISVVVVGMALLIIIVVLLLIFIWSPKEKTNNYGQATEKLNNTEVGRYTSGVTTEAQVVEMYCNEIIGVLSRQNKDEIYNMVSKDYITYRGLNKDTLFNLLAQKGITGKLLKFYSYTAVPHIKYGKVIEIEIGTYDSYIKERVLLIENSPRNYSVSFDSFIGDDTTKREIIRDGLKLTIYDVKEFVSQMQVKVAIDNISGSNIVVNTQGSYENIYLKVRGVTDIRMSSVWLSGDTKTLAPNSTVNLNLEFIPQRLFSGLAETLVIRDVYSDVTKETKNIEFPL